MASLLILKGANQGQRYELDGEKVVLGRNPDCHIKVTGTAVSRAHANIICVNGKFYIEDLKSRNGTFVNNQAITERTLLKDNDRIKICDFLCTFHDSSPVEPDVNQVTADDEDLQVSSTVEASLSHLSSNLILETQPADKLKALLEISTNLSKTLELDNLLPKIADSLFQIFRQADRAFIILRDDPKKPLVPKVIKTRRPQDETNARYSRRIVNQCMENVQALLSDDATSDSRFAMSQSISDFRIRSVMCAPVWTQDGKSFGVIQLDTQDRNKKFNQDDLKLLMGVASQASIALENAKMHQDMVARERMKRDLELAREVQRGFLPLRPPDLAGYELCADYEAAYEVGGDYYDFIPLSGQRLVATIGDVAGKGVAAALLMAKISADARFCMLTEPDPALAITKLNTLLLQSGFGDRFVTLVAAAIDANSHMVTLVNAGHPPPIIYRSNGAKLEEATPHDVCGVPLGVFEGFEFKSCQVQLEPGDSILMFSDGVTESMDVNNQQLQTKGVYNALQGSGFTPKTLVQRLVGVVKQHAAGRSQHDDLTLVAFGRMP